MNTIASMEDVSAGTDGGRPPALPDDVHREIFFHLPARSLCRARAVCRSWRDLASDPSFLRAHAGRAAASPLLLTWSDTVTKRDSTKDCTVHLTIHQDRGRRTATSGDDDGDGHGRRSRCCDLRLVLTARHQSVYGGMRSWDGILCVEMWERPQPPTFARGARPLLVPAPQPDLQGVHRRLGPRPARRRARQPLRPGLHRRRLLAPRHGRLPPPALVGERHGRLR